MLLIKEELVKVPLATVKYTPPALLLATLSMKIQSDKVPLTLPHRTPAALLAVLLIKVQLFNIPLLPDQNTAPPSPLGKLKFQKEKIQLKY